MFRIYMAGPIQHAYDKGKGWRARVKEAHPEVEWVDPMEKYDQTDDNGFDDWQSEEAEWTDERIVREDKSMIDTCDGVLIHYEKVPSWGTPREQEYTKMIEQLNNFVSALQDRGVTDEQISDALVVADLPWPKPMPVFVQTTESEPSPWMTADAAYIGERFDDVVEAMHEHFLIDSSPQ